MDLVMCENGDFEQVLGIWNMKGLFLAMFEVLTLISMAAHGKTANSGPDSRRASWTPCSAYTKPFGVSGK